MIHKPYHLYVLAIENKCFIDHFYKRILVCTVSHPSFLQDLQTDLLTFWNVVIFLYWFTHICHHKVQTSNTANTVNCAIQRWFSIKPKTAHTSFHKTEFCQLCWTLWLPHKVIFAQTEHITTHWWQIFAVSRVGDNFMTKHINMRTTQLHPRQLASFYLFCFLLVQR